MSLTNSERENSKMERGTEFDKEIENKTKERNSKKGFSDLSFNLKTKFS